MNLFSKHGVIKTKDGRCSSSLNLLLIIITWRLLVLLQTYWLNLKTQLERFLFRIHSGATAACVARLLLSYGVRLSVRHVRALCRNG